MHMDSLKNIVHSLVRIYLIFFAFAYALSYTDMPKDFGFSPVDYSEYYASLDNANSAESVILNGADANIVTLASETPETGGTEEQK